MKIKVSDISSTMYYMALAIVIVANILFIESTAETILGVNVGVWLDICDNVSKILLISRFALLERYDRKEILKIIVLFLFAFISMTASGGSRLLFVSILFIITSKNVSFNKIVKVTLIANTLGLCITFLLALTGNIDANAVSRIYDGSRVVTRFSLGFSQPNYLGSHLFIICLCLIYLMFKKMSLKIGALILVLDAFIYLTCYSRTSFILVIAILVVTSLANRMNQIRVNAYRPVEKILVWFPVIVLILVMICTVFYNENALSLINNLMSNRLRYAHEYYLEYGFSILGQPVDFSEITIRSYTIDCAYAYLAIRFGIIWTLAFTYAFYRIEKEAVKKQRLDIIVLIVTTTLWGLSETYYFRIQYNFVLILIGALIFSNGDKLLSEESESIDEITS